MTRALMEMKHLGSTLRLAVHVPSPAGGAHAENPLCACACACQHRRRCDGTGPRGRRCHVKVTMRGRRGGRGHLLAGSSKMRVTAIHLSENTLIQEPICPAPLGHSSPPGEPLTLTVVPPTGPPVLIPCSRIKRQVFTSAQRPFWGAGIQSNP